MTAGTNTGDGLRCRRCAHHARPGDRYCEQCGSALGVAPARQQPTPDEGWPAVYQGPAGGAPASGTSNETTRYLCAAAHIDEEFCDAAIAEFLVEPVRAIPPSPGLDSATVLREAVAARTRRRIRDGLLLALLVVLALVNTTVAIFWVMVVAMAVVGLSVLARADRRTVTDPARLLASGARRNRRTLVVVVIAVALVLGAVLFPFAVTLEYLLAQAVGGYGSPMGPFSVWPVLLVGSLMLVVLIVDEFTVAKLMTSSFQRGRFDPDPRRAPSEWERLVRSLGKDAFRAGLARVARSDESSQSGEQADVIVYRGYNPFLGAGHKVDHHVIALPLEPSEDETDGDPIPIDVNDLHRHVAEALAGLRSSSSLGPGRRLEQLRQREQVLIPADRLLNNRFAQMQPPVLPDLSRPPLSHLPLGAARVLADHPLEWARYYRCFRVESWDRDLTTSCYLHIGTDQRMLYLEWTYFVLLPVNERYRSVDHADDSPGRTLAHSIVELIILPAKLAQWFRSMFRSRRAGDLAPARYGAAQSLRELAADTDVQNYFQDADAERYVNIMDRTLFRAVGQFLEEQGYSVVEFMQMADPVVNNYNVQGDVINSAMGSNNKVRNTREKAARPGRPK